MKKVITLCLCLMLIVSCIAPTALADNAVIQVSGSTALDGDYDSVADYFTSYLSAAAQLEGPMTVTLLDDVEISGNTPIMLSNTDNETPSILDLNGHTITVSGSIGVLVGSTSRCPFIIKNGTIDVNASSGADGGAIVLQDGHTTISNVLITSDEGVSGATGINFINSSAIQANIENSIIDVGSQNSDVEIQSNGSLTIISAHFGNLNLDPTDTKIHLDDDSTQLKNNPEGVTGTVIVSAATTAMIVKDGNAYLYDTLQDAVNAVDADDTIQLLKQPTEQKVVVPDNLQFSIKAFENSGVNTDNINLETGDGKQVVIGENGTVEVVVIPAESITLDKTSVEIFKNQTVTLTATVSPANTTDTVTWSSNDSSVATVDAYGVVTGVSQGTATIMAKAGDKTASCTVTVDPTWIVKLDGVEYKVIKGQPFTFPSAPTKPGYIFMGWRGADGVTYQPGDKVAITGDTSFKAIWANMPDITPGTPDVPDDEPDVDVFPFYDVSAGAWYYDAVKYVWEHELMNGVSATQFSPNTTLNRAMIWTMLARLDGVNTDGGASWYAKAQEWAVAEGVSDGTDPMGAVTREQLVTMLWRFKGEPTVDFLLTAKDADTVSSWAYEAMRWAVAEGIIEGDENGMISPTATATRAQAAAIFMRFIEL